MGTYIVFALGLVKMFFVYGKGQQSQGHTLSLLLIHPHSWARLLELWRGDPVISNSEGKFDLGTENVQEVNLNQKEPCIIKLETSRCFGG